MRLMYHTRVWEVIGSRKQMLRFGWQFASPDLSRTCFVSDLPRISTTSRHIPTEVTKVPRCQEWQVTSHESQVTRDVFSPARATCEFMVNVQKRLGCSDIVRGASSRRRRLQARCHCKECNPLTCANFLDGCTGVQQHVTGCNCCRSAADFAESTCIFTDLW